MRGVLRLGLPMFAVVVFAGPAMPAGAQGHPNVPTGLSPESAYDSSGIDNVSLFAGALTVGPIPLGPRYTVSSTLSYGAHLVYNSNLWDYWPVVHEGQPYVEAVPSHVFNAGTGWSLSFGRLLHPGHVYNQTDS